VRFVERRIDLKFELVGLIGPAATVAGWGGAEPQRHEPARGSVGRTSGGGGAKPPGGDVVLTIFLGVEIIQSATP
jgi:hypothetical protein